MVSTAREADRAKYRLHDFPRTRYDFVCRIVFPAGWSAVYTASNAGFITGMYMVFVPIFGMMLGMATVWPPGWVYGCSTGLYLLGVDDQYQMGYGDLLQLVGAGIWALHILVIDHFTKHVPGVELACGQFIVCSILGIFVSTVFAGESTAWSQLVTAGPTLVYAGIVMLVSPIRCRSWPRPRLTPFMRGSFSV